MSQPKANTNDFNDAATRVKKLPSLPKDILLRLYGLFKQATQGDQKEGPRPGVFDLSGRAKFDAWAQFLGTKREVAEKEYIALVEDLERDHAIDKF